MSIRLLIGTLALLLVGCQSLGTRTDLAELEPAPASRIAADVTSYLSEYYGREDRIWSLPSPPTGDLTRALITALRAAGYEVSPTPAPADANDTEAPRDALQVRSFASDQRVIVTLDLPEERLTRVYRSQDGEPLGAWARRVP